MRKSYNSKENFVKYSKEVHGDKFSYDLIGENDVKNVNSKVTLKCIKCNNIFKQCIHNHINHGQGCLVCSGKSAWTLSKFLYKAKKIHNDKYNYTFISSNEVCNRKSVLNIKCNNCNDFFKKTLISHINGSDCPTCSNTLRWSLKRLRGAGSRVHDNKYSYDLINDSEISNNRSKINIRCIKCSHIFNQSINDHINGKSGCPKCSKYLPWRNRKYEELYNKLNSKYNELFTFPTSSIIKNNKSKINITCNTCLQSFDKSINNLLSNNVKCLNCSKPNIIYKYSTRNDVVKRILDVHGDKYSLIKYNGKGVLSNLNIKCNICNNIFVQTINNHINNKQGCPNCANNVQYTLHSFIEKSKKAHGNKFSYSLIKESHIKNNLSILNIICNTCNTTFKSRVRNHLQNKIGCTFCMKNSPYSRKKFLTKANDVHKDKYDYSNNNLNEIKSYSRISINCKVCNFTFKQRVSDHINRKSGCPSCAKKIRWTYKRLITESNKIHKNKFSYHYISEEDVTNSYSLIKLICNNCSNEFSTTINSHINAKTGCTKCSRNVSKKETIWLDKLSINEKNRQISLPKISKRIKVDGYDPKTKTVYEFYGDFWHGNLNIYKANDLNNVVKRTFGDLYLSTIKRENLIKEAGYNLVTIWEYEFDKE